MNFLVYSLPLFKCLLSVIECPQNLQRELLWLEWKKMDMLSSSLGIILQGGNERPLRNCIIMKMNQSLLGKWMWRLRDDWEGLWKEIVI